MKLKVKKTLNYNGKPYKHAWYDLGLAIGNLSLQATSLGIYLHQMGGFNPEKARELLEIPEDYEAVSAIALGYLGKPEILPDHLKERENAPRNRKLQKDFVFEGIFRQKKAELLQN